MPRNPNDTEYTRDTSRTGDPTRTKSPGSGTDRGTSGPINPMPEMPKRKWWQHIPGLGQGYEDQLAKYQNDYNYWMYQQSNEYNTPANQMARFKDAGLNTNLMYGQGSPGNAEMGQKAEKPDRESPAQHAQNILSMKMQGVQMDKIRADTKYTESKTVSEPWSRALTHVRNQLTSKQLEDLQQDMSAKSLTLNDLTHLFNVGKMSMREGSVLAKYGKEMAGADKGIIEARMQKELEKWLKANQLSKWIPVLGPILSILTLKK